MLTPLTNDRTVDEGGEFFGAIAEVVADRRKRQHNVQVLPDELNKVLPAIFSIWDKPLRLDLICHVVHLMSNTKNKK